MAAITTFSPAAKLHAGETYVRPSIARPRIFSLNSTFFGSKITTRQSSAKLTRASGAEPGASTGFTPVRAAHHSFDVVVIGAGIIGLTIARQFLTESDLSVAVVDRAIPCSGATGAGQGYIWMAHKTPGSDTWGLALRSHKLWKMMADGITNQGLDPRDEMGWMRTGSLLVGRTLEESVKLNRRVKQLSEAGLRAEFLTSSKLQLEEPALSLEKESGAAFFPDDSQLDAHRAVAFIQKGNREFAPEGRYAEFFHDPVVSVSRSGNRGEVKAVQTSKNTIHCRKAVVVATGCWTGSLMQNLYKESEVQIDIPVKPRKGHLLVVENFDSLPLNHGLMEAGYVNHLPNALPSSNSASSVDDGQELSVSMTATLDLMGNLVLGSSRQFVGFNTEVDENIINLIWKRAEEFFPKLRETSLSEISKSRNVRVGLRPYMPDGKPVISHVPGSSNVYVAAGHEGGGLSLALGTAEMVADMVLGNPTKVDSAPFSIEGRCC